MGHPGRPIFVATHPRACSTAFERVFMTQRDTLKTIHEPFGDSFYFGPERLSPRYENDPQAREESGFQNSTFKSVLDEIKKASAEGKRLFIKDIAHYLFPVDGKPAKIAPSFASPEETSNPTVIPEEELAEFQFAFLIRHPRRAIPSYYRCTIPPLREITGFDDFMPSEAGYRELRQLFDFLMESGIVSRKNVVVVDGDDMLDDPEQTIRDFCDRVGLEFSPSMLNWSEEDNRHAVEAFEKWKGFHEDALESTSLKPRQHAHKSPTIESEDEQWKEKYGEKAQKMIRQCVNDNVADYQYLKSFALQV